MYKHFSMYRLVSVLNHSDNLFKSDSVKDRNFWANFWQSKERELISIYFVCPATVSVR